MHLSGELEELVRARLRSGRYDSADAVISEALHVLEDRDQELDARAAAFKQDIETRLSTGPATPMDFPALKARIHSRISGGEDSRRR